MTRKFVYGADELHFLGHGPAVWFYHHSSAPAIADKNPRYALHSIDSFLLHFHNSDVLSPDFLDEKAVPVRGRSMVGMGLYKVGTRTKSWTN